VTGLAGATGAAAAVLHFAGALKSTPLLAALPFDLTLAAAGLLAVLLPLLVLARDWRAAPAIALPLAACGACWVWMVLAGAWSPSRGVLAAKLPEAVLAGPVMLAAGLAVAGEAGALRAAAAAALAIGAFTAGAVAWGLATDGVVLGGPVGGNPDQVRVQYQIAGLAIASAAGLAAVRAVEAARPAAFLGWGALVAALGAAALLPGGRTALAGLALAVALAPAARLWRDGRRGLALAWPLGAVGAALGALLVILADPTLAAGLRTLERVTEGDLETSGRGFLWSRAAEIGGAALPWGLGTGGFGIAAGHGDWRGAHPHNHALESLAEGGLPGLLFWLAAFGGGAAAALRLAGRAEAGRAARIAALVLPVALTVMVSTDLGNRMAWFALGLALGLGMSAEGRDGRVLRQAGG
jgi:O-antigen ligase